MDIGDVVKLKSGGPPMTVTRSDVGAFGADGKPQTGGGVIYCGWFTKEWIWHHATFPADCVATCPVPKGEK